MGEWRYSSTILILALGGGEWTASFPGRFTAGERAAGTHWIGGWVGHMAGLYVMKKRKIPPLLGIEPRPPSPKPIAMPTELSRLSFIIINSWKRRSQWPRGLRNEMSSPAWILGFVGSNPLEAWMFVCVYSVFVLSCVGSGLATDWSLVQGVLLIVYKCKITEPHKEEAKARNGLQRHIRRRRIFENEI
jgi:hypothetical protein